MSESLPAPRVEGPTRIEEPTRIEDSTHGFCIQFDRETFRIEFAQGTHRQEVELALVMLAIAAIAFLVIAPDLGGGFRQANAMNALEFWLPIVFATPWCAVVLMAVSRFFRAPIPCHIAWDTSSMTYDSGRFGWGLLSERYPEEYQFQHFFRRMFQRRIRWRLNRADTFNRPMRWSISEKEWLLHVGDDEYSFGVNIPSAQHAWIAQVITKWQSEPSRLPEIFELASQSRSDSHRLPAKSP